jgi:hypothetical protein
MAGPVLRVVARSILPGPPQVRRHRAGFDEANDPAHPAHPASELRPALAPPGYRDMGVLRHGGTATWGTGTCGSGGMRERSRAGSVQTRRGLDQRLVVIAIALGPHRITRRGGGAGIAEKLVQG